MTMDAIGGAEASPEQTGAMPGAIALQANTHPELDEIGVAELEFGISYSSLKRVRSRLELLEGRRFESADLVLAISMCAGGGWLASLFGGAQLQLGVLPLPTLLFGTMAAGLVYYVMKKRETVQQPDGIAREILDELPTHTPRPEWMQQTCRLIGDWEFTSITGNSGKSSSGLIRVNIKRGRLVADGAIYGQRGRMGNIHATRCLHDPETNSLYMIYRIDAFNDDGTRMMSECIFDGSVQTPDHGSSLEIRGSWWHIAGESVAGTATFVKKK